MGFPFSSLARAGGVLQRWRKEAAQSFTLPDISVIPLPTNARAVRAMKTKSRRR
jgi:hypothetical protein